MTPDFFLGVIATVVLQLAAYGVYALLRDVREESRRRQWQRELLAKLTTEPPQPHADLFQALPYRRMN